MNNDQIVYIENRHKLLKIIRDIIVFNLNLDIDPEDIPADAILFGDGLRLDSIDALQLMTVLENTFDIKLPQDDPLTLRSVNTIVDFILENKKSFSIQGISKETHIETMISK